MNRGIWYNFEEGDNKMANELNSEMVKAYALSEGASVVGIAASKDFGLAPDGFKPTDVLTQCYILKIKMILSVFN